MCRLSTELQNKQKSYEEYVDKSNSIQLDLEKKLHEMTQNLAARTSQWEIIENEVKILSMQKIDRENELNLELAEMKEAAIEEKNSLVEEINVLKVNYQEEKARLLKEVDEKLKEAETLNGQLNLAVQNLENSVDELKRDVEKSKNEVLAKEESYNAKIKEMQLVEEELKRQLDESIKKESELKSYLNEEKKSGVECVETLTKQLQEKSSYSEELERQLEKIRTTNDKTTTENDELKAQLLAAEIKNKELTESSTEEKRNFSEIKSKLEQEIGEAMSNFKSTEDEQVDLVNKNVELVQRVEQLNREISEANSCIGEVKNELNKVLSDFDAFKLSAETGKQVIDAKLLEAFKKEADSEENRKLLESENVQLKQTILDTEKKASVISSSLHEVRNEYETLKSEAATSKESAQVQISSLQHEAAEHIKTIQLLEAKIDQLTSSVNLSDDLKNELNHKSEEIKSKEINIAELSNVVTALKEQINVKENDLKRLVGEKEMEGKQSIDIIVSKDEEINSLHLQIEAMKKSLEDKVVESANLSEQTSSLSSEKLALIEEVSGLKNQIKNFTDNFVDRTELNNLKEEFGIYEETKENEIANLSKKLLEIEQQLQSQNAGVNKLEMLERNQREIAHEKTVLERREAQLVIENKQLTDKLQQMKV